MADAHHDTTRNDQRRSGKAVFFRAQQRCDHDVASALHLPVGLNNDAAAKIVQHEHLMRFRQAKLPRNAGMLQTCQRRSAGSAAVAGYQHNVSVRFRNARRDRTDTDFGNELDADACAWI